MHPPICGIDFRNAAFGFTAAILEGLPIIGLFFTVSNRIGAAMWAHGEFVAFHCILDS
jgi:hypothetical protein